MTAWLILLTMVLAVWLLWRDQRNLRSMIVVFLDELARDHGLKKVTDPGSES